MSKKINIDFSAINELETQDLHWKPTSEDYFGSYGYSEVRTATANFLQIGDVGDEDWRNARSLPFGDEALEAFYPGRQGISFIQYPWEHPDADTVTENPVQRMLEKDLAFEWALKEMESLEPGSERYEQLTDLVVEIRNYNSSQIEEEAFIHAPSWAMDTLLYAQEKSYDPEVTKIIEEFSPRKSMQAKVITTAMYPDTKSLKSINNIYDEYEIKLPEGTHQHCFALKDGKKVFGPYGPKYSSIRMYKSPDTYNSETKKFRKDQLIRVLNESGIIPTFNEEGRLEHINHDYITSDNILQAKQNYCNLANVISDANSTMSFVVQHIKGLQEDIYWDKLKDYLVKVKAYNNVLDWSAGLNLDNKRAPCLRAIGHKGLEELVDNYETLRSDIHTKINTTYYALIVGKNTKISITDSKDLAAYFKAGNSDDLLYFLLDKKLRDKLGTLSEVTNIYGYESSEYKLWKKQAISAITSNTKYSQSHIQELVSQYNANRRVKTITSRTMREYGWIFSDLPFTRQEINILNDSLEAYGRAIIATQQNLPIVKQVFGRLKTRLELDVKEKSLPSFAIDSIRNRGTVNFVYSAKTKSLPNLDQQEALKKHGLLSKEEIDSGKYLDIELNYDYIFTNPSDVFKYVSNFVPNLNTIRLINSF